MKNSSAFLILLFLVASTLPAQYRSANNKLDQMIQQGMEEWQIPGLSVVVVKNGDVIYKKAYGIRDIHTGEFVDEQTMFAMASTTKAFIAISMGMLVDKGLMNWDDKVRSHLPSFQLSNAYITEDARIKDLLTHNLGIGNADMIWYLDSASTEETINRFSLAEQAYPLRGGFVYQNLMYAIAGEVIEAVSGMPWETFVEQNIFQPLGMTRSVTSPSGIRALGNHTTPHVDDRLQGVITLPILYFDQVGAAGALWSCADDMARYLEFILNKGIHNGDTLLKPATFDYLFKPQVIITDSEFYPTQRLTRPKWKTYGLGWFQHDYRGEKLDFHTGSIDGLVAITGLMFSKDLGVYVFANLDHAELRHAIMYMVMDLYGFEDNNRDWHRDVFEMYKGFEKLSLARLDLVNSDRVTNTRHSLPLHHYAGNYVHPMFGEVEIEVNQDDLLVHFNEVKTVAASHWHYNTFRTLHDPMLGQVMINFQLNTAGKVSSAIIMNETFIKE